jgi:hypothetical protein
MTKYSKEQYQKAFEKLPNDLKEIILSEETAKDIYDICLRNEVDDYVSEIASYVGDILIGFLPPEELPVILERELKIEPETAKSVAQEINRFIFFPVKDKLAEFYKIEFAPGGRIIPRKKEGPSIPSEERPSILPETKEIEKPKKSTTDIYREPIE